MKKMMLTALCLIMAAALMLPVFASEHKVVLAAGAQFTPGKTLTVDIEKMSDMDARIYQAWKEDTVQYQWYSGNKPVSGGTEKSYTIQSGDKSVKVEVICQDLVLTSASYLVTNMAFVVTTKAPTKATTVPTTAATTAPTTAATTVPTTIATTVLTSTAPVAVTPVEEPAAEPVAEPVAELAAEPVAEQPVVMAAAPETKAPATTPAAPVLAKTSIEPAPEAFPWWIAILAIGGASALLGVAMMFKKRCNH